MGIFSYTQEEGVPQEGLFRSMKSIYVWKLGISVRVCLFLSIWWGPWWAEISIVDWRGIRKDGSFHFIYGLVCSVRIGQGLEGWDRLRESLPWVRVPKDGREATNRFSFLRFFCYYAPSGLAWPNVGRILLPCLHCCSWAGLVHALASKR